MGTETRTQGYTFEEFCLLVKDGQKADLIDGVIYMASPENTDANELFTWLGALMSGYARRKRLGKVYGSRVAFRITDVNSPEPDLGFVRTDRLHLVHRGFVEGPRTWRWRSFRLTASIGTIAASANNTDGPASENTGLWMRSSRR